MGDRVLNESIFLHRLYQYYSLAFFKVIAFSDTDAVAHLAFDESMCGWLSKLCESLRKVPRKREEQGLLIYTIATFLSSTSKPVILFMLPNLKDEHSENYGYKEVFLLQMKILYAAREAMLIPRHISVVSDRLFAFPDIISGDFYTKGIWCSVGLKKDTDLAKILCHKCVKEKKKKKKRN